MGIEKTSIKYPIIDNVFIGLKHFTLTAFFAVIAVTPLHAIISDFIIVLYQTVAGTPVMWLNVGQILWFIKEEEKEF